MEQDSTNLLSEISPGLTAASLNETAKTIESIETVRFMHNPWTPMVNHSLQGFRFGVQHPLLDRLSLIPIPTWKTPVIVPRQGGFGVGMIVTGSTGVMGGGAFPTGSVGSRVTNRLQYPSESVAALLTAYGPDGPNDIGFVELQSLMAESDRDKLDSVLLFKAIMELPYTPKKGEPGEGESIKPGREWLLGDLIAREDAQGNLIPGFLDNVAPLALKKACFGGLTLLNGQVVTLSAPAYHKGQKLLAELRASVAAARVRAYRILDATKSDLADAKNAVKDVKRKLDPLDKWLLGQFYYYSMDSELERGAQLLANAQQGNAAAADLSSANMQQILSMQQQTLDRLAGTQEMLAESQETNRALTERLLSMQPPPAEASQPAAG